MLCGQFIIIERYREDAKRAIFFARWEAQQSSSAYIEPKHILLGLTHDADSKVNQLFGLSACTEDFRSLLGIHASVQPSTSVDLSRYQTLANAVWPMPLKKQIGSGARRLAQNICCWACCGKKNRACRKLWQEQESICVQRESGSGQHRTFQSVTTNRTTEKLH